jgi:hypothetical protein
MEFLLGIIVLVLDIVAVVDVLKGTLANEKKILWVILILLLPVVGLVLYYLLGRPAK